MPQPQVAIRELVPNGWKTVARRGITDIDNIRARGFSQIRAFAQFRSALERIERTGDPRLVSGQVDRLIRVFDGGENALRTLKGVAADLGSFTAFCLEVVGSAYGESVPILLARQGIFPAIEAEVGDRPSQIYVMHEGDLKYIAGKFVYNPDKPAYFALTNIKHLSAVCAYRNQLEIKDAIDEIFNEHPIIDLLKEIQKHKDGKHSVLDKMYRQDMFDVHPVVFLVRKEVIKLARELGLDIDDYLRKVSLAVPKVTVLYCLASAHNFASVFDGLTKSEFFGSPDRALILQLYRTMFLANQLFNAQKVDVETIGFALGGNFEETWAQLEQIKADPVLQVEFTRTYFPSLFIPTIHTPK
ncbi:hypothetical protein HY988_07765 [Candidatus Micrarchaeota archaeon]|nr:hypothetical protein [Candidatus Micrarchaeota archaeon]